MMRLLSSLAVLVVVATAAVAADSKGSKSDLKDGWTPKLLASQTADCTEATVRDAWENTKRAQGVDPATPLTKAVRKKLAPEIAAMKKLCACAIHEAAKRYTRAEVEASPEDLQSFLAETVSNGTCKLEQP